MAFTRVTKHLSPLALLMPLLLLLNAGDGIFGADIVEVPDFGFNSTSGAQLQMFEYVPDRVQQPMAALVIVMHG